jgi:hypothetical protein
MSKFYEAVPKNLPYSTNTKYVVPPHKANIVDTYPQAVRPAVPLQVDSVKEIEQYIQNNRNINFDAIESILKNTFYNSSQRKDSSKAFINIYEYQSYIELARSSIKNTNTIVSPVINTMFLTIKLEELSGLRLSHLVGVAFFSAYNSSRPYAELFINEAINCLEVYGLNKKTKSDLNNIFNNYRNKYILQIEDAPKLPEQGIEDLLLERFNKHDLDKLLIYLDVIDRDSKLAIPYAGRAQGKISGFTAAYRALALHGLIKKTMYPNQWAVEFRKCYKTTLTVKTARYEIKGHSSQCSKAFEKQYYKALEWVEVWLLHENA